MSGRADGTTAPRTSVWFLIGTLVRGGAERTLIDLVNGMDEERFDVTVWTIAEPGPLAGEIRDEVPVRSLDASGKADLAAPLRFVSALREERPAVLQSFLRYDNALAALSGRFVLETTVITGVREVPDGRSRVETAELQAVHSLADRVISNSQSGAEFATDLGVSPERVGVVHNGRDVERFASATLPDKLHDELGLRPNTPTVGTVGRLVERKGHYDLLEAWPDVLESHPDAELLVVGDGPERDGLSRRAREIGVADSVRLPGERDDVPELLALLDCFAFPSHYEGLPGALLEAMAARLPIVTTPVTGNSELVTDDREGIHVPVRDAEALSTAIATLLSDTDLAKRLAERAQKTAFEEFTIESMVAEFQAEYEAILND